MVTKVLLPMTPNLTCGQYATTMGNYDGSSDPIDFSSPYSNGNCMSQTSNNLLSMQFDSFLNSSGINPLTLNQGNYEDTMGIFNFSNLIFPQFNSFLNMPKPMRWMHNFIGQSFNTKTNLAALKDVYNPEISKRLAQISYQNAMETGTIGWCAKGVRNSLQQSGIDQNGDTRVAAACMAVNKFREHADRFQEVKVGRGDLKNLPAGCIVVWDKSEGHQYGHITVTLGNGQEASDHVQSLITNRNANFAVFVPVDKKGQNNKH